MCKEVLAQHRPISHPSELVRECEIRRQRIEDCGAGFLEIGYVSRGIAQERCSTPSWIRQQILFADEREESVGDLRCSLECLGIFHEENHVQFIHRSAVDFLLDSEEGREILASDQTSLNEHFRSAQQATLFAFISGASKNPEYRPSLVLFNRGYPISDLNERRFDNDLARTAGKFYHRLFEELELLSNQKSCNSRGMSCLIPTKALELLSDMIYFAVLHGKSCTVQNFIKGFEEKGYAVTDEFRNYLLFRYCGTSGLPADWVGVDLIVWLLRAGADPNYSSTSMSRFVARGQALSSFEAYLFIVPDLLSYDLSHRQIDGIETVIREFIKHGADLAKKIVYIYKYTCPAGIAWSIRELNVAQLVQIVENALHHARLKTGQPNTNTLGSLGPEKYGLHRKLLIVSTVPLELPFGELQKHKCYAAKRTGSGECQISDELHQRVERIPLSAEDVIEDKEACETLEAIIHHGEEIHNVKAWLERQGFRFRTEEDGGIPEPFHGFREVYGGAAGSTPK